MRWRGWRRLASAIGHRVVVLAFTLFAVFPFYWMLVTSFKQNSDLYVGATNTAHNPFIFNLPPTLDHIRLLFGQTRFVRWLGNTALVGAIVVAITLLLALPAAYALTRLTGRWGERLGIAIFRLRKRKGSACTSGAAICRTVFGNVQYIQARHSATCLR